MKRLPTMPVLSFGAVLSLSAVLLQIKWIPLRFFDKTSWSNKGTYKHYYYFFALIKIKKKKNNHYKLLLKFKVEFLNIYTFEFTDFITSCIRSYGLSDDFCTHYTNLKFYHERFRQ